VPSLFDVALQIGWQRIDRRGLVEFLPQVLERVDQAVGWVGVPDQRTVHKKSPPFSRSSSTDNGMTVSDDTARFARYPSATAGG